MDFEFEKPPLCLDCGKEFPLRNIPFSGPTSVCSSCCCARFNARTVELSKDEWGNKATKALIPIRYQSYMDTTALKQARIWVCDSFECQKPMYIRGPVRIGKTLALSLLARKLIYAEYTVYFIHCSEFAVYLRGNPNLHTEWHNRLTNCHHLILDDLGAQYDGTGWFSGWLCGVVNSRYANFRPTSASTNTPKLVEARIASRLEETCLIVEHK